MPKFNREAGRRGRWKQCRTRTVFALPEEIEGDAMSYYDDACVSESEAAAFRASSERKALGWLTRYHPEIATPDVAKALVDYEKAVANNDFS